MVLTKYIHIQDSGWMPSARTEGGKKRRGPLRNEALESYYYTKCGLKIMRAEDPNMDMSSGFGKTEESLRGATCKMCVRMTLNREIGKIIHDVTKSQFYLDIFYELKEELLGSLKELKPDKVGGWPKVMDREEFLRSGQVIDSGPFSTKDTK